MNDFPPFSPLVPLGPFRFFSKIREDIDVVVISGKSTAGIVDTGKFTPVSTTPVVTPFQRFTLKVTTAVNLPPMSMTLADSNDKHYHVVYTLN
jgi:hypothetical protein